MAQPECRIMVDRKIRYGWVILKRCGEREYREGFAKVDAEIEYVFLEHEKVRQAYKEEVKRSLAEQRR